MIRHPIRYDQLSVLDQVVATDKVRLQLQVLTENSRGWRNLGSTQLQLRPEAEGNLDTQVLHLSPPKSSQSILPDATACA